MKQDESTLKPEGDHEQPLISHLAELRTRLIHSMISVLVVFLALAPFSTEIYNIISTPLIKQLPEGTSMIATEVASPFLVPFKLTMYTAIFIVMPYLLFQIWSFIAPGLYRTEKRFAMPLLFSSIILFYAGTAFAFFIVFPLVFAFFASVTPEGVAMMTDISHYLDFIIKMFFAFGLAFEVPIATILLIMTGLVSIETMRQKRPYIIIGAFVIGMVLTPPDVLSQFLLATPMLILFELGLYFSRYFVKAETVEADEEEVSRIN
jgi:sec-independent protein translocase protein TatC